MRRTSQQSTAICIQWQPDSQAQCPCPPPFTRAVRLSAPVHSSRSRAVRLSAPVPLRQNHPRQHCARRLRVRLPHSRSWAGFSQAATLCTLRALLQENRAPGHASLSPQRSARPPEWVSEWERGVATEHQGMPSYHPSSLIDQGWLHKSRIHRGSRQPPPGCRSVRPWPSASTPGCRSVRPWPPATAISKAPPVQL